MIRKRFKQLICKHHYRPWANLTGECATIFEAQTVYLCPKCYKRKFKKEYIEAPLDYNQILYYISVEKSCEDDIIKKVLLEGVKESIVKDENLYLKYFGGNN